MIDSLRLYIAKNLDLREHWSRYQGMSSIITMLVEAFLP